MTLSTAQFHDVASRWAGDTRVQNSTITTGASGTDLAEFFSFIPSASGYPVTESTALTIATVYRCVAIIGGAIAQLPIHHFRVTGNGERVQMPKTNLWWALNESPHPLWTASAWKEWIARAVMLRGDSYAHIQRDIYNEVVRIKPLKNVTVLKDGDCLIYSYTGEDEKRITLMQEDVLHFAGFGFDGERSLSVLQWAARQSVGTALAASDFAARTFKEGAMPQIALRYPNKLSPEQATQLKESFLNTYGGTNGRKFPLVLSEGGDAKELSMSPEDMQLLATRQFEKNDIATAFGVPPIMLGDNEKTTSWGTGIEQITIGFVRYTLKPHLIRWEEELNRKLFSRAGQFVEFEVDGLLRGDSKAQADYFKAALGGPGAGPGWMSVNEVRKLRNLPPVENGEKPFYPQDGGKNETKPPQPPSQ